MPQDHTFAGEVGITVAESVPSWHRAAQPRTLPNVLVVILDDVGWADLGCYGSEISTPTVDALAANGVRYNRFHVTPLCSPTRASLLTGRNHHALGMRFLADTDTGFPNSRGYVRHDVPMLPEILRQHGYGTYLAGKWHLAPLHEITPAGPFLNWPLARGFDRFYGFLDGCTDQYEPELYADNHPVPVPVTEGYHLSSDLADTAVRFVEDHLAFRPESPFYLQLALGAVHAPFQAPREYIDKYVSVFEKGWDHVREDRLRRQNDLGLAPAGTRLAERNPGVRPWDELDDDERKVYSHLQAAFAGFLEHADHQLGRVLEQLDALGVRDDTIVILLSDNGASREGREHGDVDANAPYSSRVRPPREQISLLDELGGPAGGAHYPEGWAMAGNTPFRLYKQFVDLGGSRAPLVISWAKGIEQAGRIEQSFMHVVDIAPTLLELIGIRTDHHFDGKSAATAVVAPALEGGRPTQYWEMMGRRAIWHDGWRAVSNHIQGQPYSTDTWRLYDTRSDFSESVDLASAYPEKVAELERLWWSQAHLNDVFPLDDRSFLELIYSRGPDGLFARQRITLFPGQHIPVPSAITGSNREILVTAHLSSAPDACSGMLLSSGNVQGGYHFYLRSGALVFEHGTLGQRTVVTAEDIVSAAATTVGFHLVPEGDGSGSVVLLVDGRPAAEGRIPQVTDHLSFWGMDVGKSGPTSFSPNVTAPFELPGGVMSRLEIEVRGTAQDVEGYAQLALAGE